MKKLFFTPLIAILTISCSGDLELTYSEADNITENTYFSFDAVTYPEVWASFNSLQEMQEACQIPKKQLTEMSTDELVQVCLNYPLFGNYLAYDNEMDGINAVMSGFNGFEELQKRDDGVAKLIEAYKQMGVTAVTRNVDKNVPNPIRLGYIELILASSRVADSMDTNELQQLQQIVDQKYAEKLQHPDICGKTSLRRSLILASQLKLKSHDLGTTDRPRLKRFVKSAGSSASDEELSEIETATTRNITIKTKYGQSVVGLLRSELTASEIEEYNKYVKSYYPQATILSDASSTYNCHSYAWNMSDGGTTCWINATISTENDNLSKYWTNDYYRQTSNSNNAFKIFYYNSDHSAITSLMSGMYESKWGALPLMRHAPGYGPYNDMTNRYYYSGVSGGDSGSDKVVYGTINSSTPGAIAPGENIDFTINNYIAFPSTYYKWIVENAKEIDVTTTNVTITETGNGTARITFKKQGIYTVHYKVYNSSTNALRASYSSDYVYIEN